MDSPSRRVPVQEGSPEGTMRVVVAAAVQEEVVVEAAPDQMEHNLKAIYHLEVGLFLRGEMEATAVAVVVLEL